VGLELERTDARDRRGRLTPATGGPAAERDLRIAREALERSAAAIAASTTLLGTAVTVAERIAEAFGRGGKLLICGNGGSAADAQHFAAEMVGRFNSSDRAALPAIALSADTAILTAVANDFGYDEVFARQVRALARPGDVLVGISTSGEAPNVIGAFEAAPPGVTKVALTGPRGRLADGADLQLRVPAEGTAAIQAAHGALIHAICAVLDARVAEERA
jgi:phosphoheptose isomerase